MSGPMSQSACSEVSPRRYCLTSDPNTSETDSLSAPDWLRYTRPAAYCVTPCVSSWPMMSSDFVKRSKIRPSPKTICVPFQNALS